MAHKRKIKRFKSFEAFRKHRAFIHIHGIRHKAQRMVKIGGRIYKIKSPHRCVICGKRHR